MYIDEQKKIMKLGNSRRSTFVSYEAGVFLWEKYVNIVRIHKISWFLQPKKKKMMSKKNDKTLFFQNPLMLEKGDAGVGHRNPVSQALFIF